MSSGLPGSLLFATHLFGLLVAAGAGLSLLLERGRSRMARASGCAGFAALAVAEAVHGAGFLGELDPSRAWIRTGGYVLILLGALLPDARSTVRVPAAIAVPGGAVTPFLAAALAGIASAWRRRGERGSLWLAAGLILLGASDAVLGLESRTWAAEASHALRVLGYLAVARIVIALARHSIRFRFIVGFSALLVAVVLFVSGAIGTVIDRNLREGAIERVLGQAEQSVVNLSRRAVSRVGPLATLARTDILSGPIQKGQTISEETLRTLRDSFLADVDFVLLLDDRLQVLGRLDVPPGADFEIVGTRVVRNSLREDTPAASLDVVGKGLSLLGVAPIPSSSGGRAAGLAIAGFDVDEDLLIREAGAGPESPALALIGRRGADPVVVATAGFFNDSPEIPPSTMAVLSETYESLLAGADARGTTIRLGGEDHFAAIAPLRIDLVNGTAVGMLVVAEPTTVLAVTQRDVNQVLFLVTVGVFGLAFVLALIAARRITRPLVSLTGAARRVSAGDLDAKAEVGGEDEVADLAGAFNRMTDSVTSMTEELRLAATEQSQLRARLETVVNSMGDGLIAVDDDGRVVTYNPAAGEIVGVPRSRVVGKPLKEVLKGRDDRGRRLGARGSSPKGIAFVGRPDGSEAPVAITMSPLRDGQGTRLGRVYVLRDMSREHEVERMKREFLSNVSHELRTPLTPIIGYSEIMVRRSLPIAKAREFAVSILDSARRLERIVAMLVDFSAIEAGRMAVDLEPTQLGVLVKEVVTKTGERNPKHKFSTRVAKGLPPASVSPSLFARMLTEVLGNAVKYSPKGGRVAVAVDKSPGAGRRMLKVAVADQGIGIEDEHLARIFQDFSQVDASDTRPFGGLGLGLTFVKRIAEAHGGSVSAESRAGKGSTFSFTVPVADTRGRTRK
ncbi:MAG: sensor histidine kinase [Actinomycetota bacterium]